jgi:hypothetical protein
MGKSRGTSRELAREIIRRQEAAHRRAARLSVARKLKVADAMRKDRFALIAGAWQRRKTAERAYRWRELEAFRRRVGPLLFAAERRGATFSRRTRSGHGCGR